MLNKIIANQQEVERYIYGFVVSFLSIDEQALFGGGAHKSTTMTSLRSCMYIWDRNSKS